MPDKLNREHPELKLGGQESRPEVAGEPEILSVPVEVAPEPSPPPEILPEAPVPHQAAEPAKILKTAEERLGESGRDRAAERFLLAKTGNNGTAEDDLAILFEKKRSAENRN